ncbi:MAG TPA: hypothetical protein VH680_11070 [Gemmatimonadales bacterium]
MPWLALALPDRAALAQEPLRAHLAGQGVLALTHADPIPDGGSLTELRLVQPALMLRAEGPRRIRLLVTLNLEGATIERGELTPGAWGEGFVDRRHPHTYLHELMLTADDLLGAADGGTRVSLSAGKGFAPFGTDDPMIRPSLRYPVNHHLAQILERAVAIAAVRHGPVSGEVGLFNGDEPERPGQWPRIGGRFGDSWAARLTGEPVAGLELQGSYAKVHSPEHRGGAGTDQLKWSLSAGWNGQVVGRRTSALVEWARTSEAAGFFVFHSLLAEGAWQAGRHRLHYRFERTERPEEQRISAFRSLRPHLENSILGITRWTIHTAGYSSPRLEQGGVYVQPMLEISYGRVAMVGGGLFDPQQLYGKDHFWSWSLGLRLGFGGGTHRMGRYGAALSGSHLHQH